MEDIRFFLIALKVGQSCAHGKRILKETKPYYFCDGYTISEDGTIIIVNDEKCVDERVFNDYLREKAGIHHYVPYVSIHAIVGKNGSGKSSLVEMMIRLLNNFATILFGEKITDSYRAHLHYIDGLQGELYYMLGDDAFRLAICGRKVNLERFKRNDNLSRVTYEKVVDKNLEEISVDDAEPILDDLDLGEGTLIKHYLDAFFYTIVSNYSIYAYNTLDYQEENVKLEYERRILKDKFEEAEKKMRVSPSERNWLYGLFHKNDGYKTPLVLTPFRKEGNIDINIENTLSRERFITLLLMSNATEGNGFRLINGHLEVKGFTLKKKNNYGRMYINRNLEITKISERKYQELRIFIFSRWSEKLFDNNKDIERIAEGKIFGQIALNYLLYKTIKICTKYSIYNQAREELEKYLNSDDVHNDFLDSLNVYLDDLLENHSHITRKIRQTIAYLITPDDLDVYKSVRKYIGVNEMANYAQKMVKHVKDNFMYDFYIRDIEDMLPPPFLDVKIKLNDKSGVSKEIILFETLSSGEKQQVYSISSILYHLMNINSVEEDKSSKRFRYNYVNIVLEEIELYFHPDFQKRYITMILDGIAQIKLENIYGINICFVTHSPFVLSDIPRGNLLVLDDGKSSGDKKLKTFGANIYDMLKSSFFIEDTPIGSYAQWVINRIIVAMRSWRFLLEYPNIKGDELLKMVSSPKIEERNVEFLKRYIYNDDISSFKSKYCNEELKNMIKQIDEPLVRNSLLTEWEVLFSDLTPKEKELTRLYRRIAELTENE